MVDPELPQKEVEAEESQSIAVFQWPFRFKTLNKIRNLVTRVDFYQAMAPEKILKLVQAKTTMAEAALAKLMVAAAQVKHMVAAQIRNNIWIVLQLLI